MTNSELNRDIKRLATQYLKKKCENQGRATDEYYNWLETYAKPELRRLFYADQEMSVMTAANIRRILSLNSSIRAVSLHVIGMKIDLEKI